MSKALSDLLLSMAERRRTLDRGSYLFHRDDPVRSVFVVAEGAVELVRPQPDGKPILVQRAEDRSVIAEASLYSDRYHCDAIAAAPSVISVISKLAFRLRLAADAGFAELWSSHLATEMQKARYRSEILTRKTVSERLDAWLDWRGSGLPHKGQWKGVALQIGVSPEALYRELSKRR
ncbi:MAG: Crp/Fnr family transcriptional regulator [Hyphomicrobiales bacterium]|nr:Crp/Fnr family transcriptional regulator [Hyphomicrobiales bacterium]